MTSKQQNLNTGYLVERNFTDNQQVFIYLSFFFTKNILTMFHGRLQVLFRSPEEDHETWLKRLSKKEVPVVSELTFDQ